MSEHERTATASPSSSVAGTTLNPPTPSMVRTSRASVEYATEGDGPAMLALHGAMGGWDQSLILSHTVGAPAFRTIALSRPGYLGTALDAGHSPEAQADLYAETLDALSVTTAAAVAVSGGGPSAIHFALRHPDRCWGLVLISTCGTRVEGRLPMMFQLLMLLRRWPALLEAMARRMASADLEQRASRSIPDPEQRARTLADPEAGPLFRALLESTPREMARRLVGTRNDVLITRGREYPLEEIRVPTLVVHGTLDRVVPYVPHARLLAGRIPGAELLAVEKGDHASIFTHRRLVQPTVAAFLNRHAPTGAPRD